MAAIVYCRLVAASTAIAAEEKKENDPDTGIISGSIVTTSASAVICEGSATATAEEKENNPDAGIIATASTE